MVERVVSEVEVARLAHDEAECFFSEAKKKFEAEQRKLESELEEQILVVEEERVADINI